MNLAIDHVVTNLGKPLRLERVAKAAALSPFHFHRVFQAMTGETLADFVKRLRLEKALSVMAHGRPPSLTRLALSCGFSSSSDFSRSFKQRFGVPPRAFDIEAWRDAHRAELESMTYGTAERLMAWADRHGLGDGRWLGYQWDNPELVALEDCRYYVAVEAERFIPQGEIGRFRFPPMVVAQVEVRGGLDLELRA